MNFCVQLRLYNNKYITFCFADVAPDNFTEELPPSTEMPAQRDIYVEKSRSSPGSEIPISTAQQREAPAYVAVLIGK